jgi:[ribosomal protein S5]-alanine N-acetyltransferase
MASGAILCRVANGRPTLRVGRGRGVREVVVLFPRRHLVIESQLARESYLFVAMATLDTSRLTLRPFREDDVDLMAELFANPGFMRFSLGVFTKREQTVAFIEKVIGWDRAGIPSQFAVVPRGEDHFIGYCGFFHHPEHGIEDIEIGYRLHPDYWNRGLITEAARAVRDHGFRDLKLSRVISLIHPENVPSRRVAEKNGMTVEKEIIFRGFPTLVFALPRDRWKKIGGA